MCKQIADRLCCGVHYVWQLLYMTYLLPSQRAKMVFLDESTKSYQIMTVALIILFAFFCLSVSFRPLVTVGPAGFIAFLPLTVWALGFIPWMAKLNTIERLAKSEAIIMLKQQAPGFNLKGSEQC